MTAPTPRGVTPNAEGEWLGPVYRCELCGLTIPATPQRNQREADDWHAYASTNCPGEGRMRLRGTAPTAAEREGEELTPAELSAIEAQFKLRDAINAMGVEIEQRGSRIAESDAALLAARRENEALQPYLQHRHDCKKCPKEIEGVLYGEALPPHECTCGLDAALNLTEQR